MNRNEVYEAASKAEYWARDITLLLDDMTSMDEVTIALAKQDGLEILDEIRLHLNTIERYLS